MTQANSTAIGKKMAFIAWIIGIILLTQVFGAWEKHQDNPNQAPDSTIMGDTVRVTLHQNRAGHYRSSGTINGKHAEFMIDTGATDIVIPASLAGLYGLKSTGQGLGLTANGYVALDKTLIDELSIGKITLYNVRASLNPGMTREQPVLLGMSALSELEMSQHQGVLNLTQYQ
ncbi:MAG: TIGR02281 family clan AA aspartic protease [Oleiphilus sp.]|nr:MAG: TIGR02281 family clan AA aspartic protease [Oleiphilus sp.]